MDLLEFGRIIHSEMSALCDAARKGLSVQNATLYCTTFPCHLCAKQIVAAGIKEVVFLEPYPKSYATELHRDSIVVDPEGETAKVIFRPFIGIAPYRYRDLFEKGKRKYSGGSAQKWHQDVRRPMIEVYFPSYFRAEAAVVGQMGEFFKHPFQYRNQNRVCCNVRRLTQFLIRTRRGPKSRRSGRARR